jgi:predicted amidohydrolase YtcJ
MGAGVLPSAEDIDEVVPDRPAVLYRNCRHIAVVNSIALVRLLIEFTITTRIRFTLPDSDGWLQRLMNLTKETPDPPGGVIDRKPDGSPSGLIYFFYHPF